MIDLNHDHHRFFFYQMLRAMKYMHTANVYHRDLKPKNALVNANCKRKICDLGLARVAFSDTPTTVFWADYVATRCYRAPELCGSFFSKLDLITDLLGTPSADDTISGVRNEKARKYLMNMRKKRQVSFTEKFPNSDPLPLKLMLRMLAFDPKDRASATEALADISGNTAKVSQQPPRPPTAKPGRVVAPALPHEHLRRANNSRDGRGVYVHDILSPQLITPHSVINPENESESSRVKQQLMSQVSTSTVVPHRCKIVASSISVCCSRDCSTGGRCCSAWTYLGVVRFCKRMRSRLLVHIK